jgi:hypothetical protein
MLNFPIEFNLSAFTVIDIKVFQFQQSHLPAGRQVSGLGRCVTFPVNLEQGCCLSTAHSRGEIAGPPGLDSTGYE